MAKSKSYGGLIVLLIVIAGAAGGGWYFFRAKTVKQPEFQTTKVARGDTPSARWVLRRVAWATSTR